MKNINQIIILTLLLSHLNVKAQVGIGTTTPNASAKLDITSTNKGFLPPRVTLTGTADVSTIPNPATGLFIYNTATAGTSPSNVTPGLYYYDGIKWQRIINQQPDATIEFNQVTPTTAGVVFTPNTPASKDYVYVSTVDNSQWTYNGSAYVTYTPPASTAWNLAGGNTDASSNKTGGIVRTGNIGIGNTNFSPTTKVDVRATSPGTGFRLMDGSQGTNKVLSSDANGNASWATNVSITPAIIGVMGVGANTLSQNSWTGAYITLPNGKWSVQVNMLATTPNDILNDDVIWMRTSFSTSSTANTMASGSNIIGPSLVSGLIRDNYKLNMLTGTIIINNTTGVNVTYYYWLNGCDYTTATFSNLGRNTFGENSIVAYPMN
jgi:hypothetical protein